MSDADAHLSLFQIDPIAPEPAVDARPGPQTHHQQQEVQYGGNSRDGCVVVVSAADGENGPKTSRNVRAALMYAARKARTES